MPTYGWLSPSLEIHMNSSPSSPLSTIPAARDSIRTPPLVIVCHVKFDDGVLGKMYAGAR